MIVLLPTLATGVYYGLVASDRYVSEARFVVRTANKPGAAAGGLGALLQLAGLSQTQDDTYAVRDYMTSRDALHELTQKLDLRKMYDDPDADFLARYPSVLFGRSDEEFYRYFQYAVSVVVNTTTGVTTLDVQAFHPKDAYQVAHALLGLGEGLVNRLNQRMQEDAVRVARDEVARTEQRRIAAQIAVEEFRNRELILDPDKNAAIVIKLIGGLAGQLAEVRAQLAETRGNSPNSPQLATLRQRATAIEQQIDLERSRVANSSDALAAKIAEYETLMLQQEFAISTLAQAVSALEMAQVEARRQQLFLERVVEPGVPDDAIMPQRWRTVLTVFGFNVIGLGVLWLIGAGLREHAAHAGR
jgi:capsular polysaccharide transport system permease protein